MKFLELSKALLSCCSGCNKELICSPAGSSNNMTHMKAFNQKKWQQKITTKLNNKNETELQILSDDLWAVCQSYFHSSFTNEQMEYLQP